MKMNSMKNTVIYLYVGVCFLAVLTFMAMSKNGELQRQVNYLESSVENYRDEKSELNEEIYALNEGNSTLSSQLNKYRTRYNEEKEKNTLLEEKIDELEAEIEKLRTTNTQETNSVGYCLGVNGASQTVGSYIVTETGSKYHSHVHGNMKNYRRTNNISGYEPCSICF